MFLSHKFAFEILVYLVYKPIKNWRYVLLDPGRSVYMYLILGSSKIPFKILIDSVDKSILGFLSKKFGVGAFKSR